MKICIARDDYRREAEFLATRAATKLSTSLSRCGEYDERGEAAATGKQEVRMLGVKMLEKTCCVVI